MSCQFLDDHYNVKNMCTYVIFMQHFHKIQNKNVCLSIYLILFKWTPFLHFCYQKQTSWLNENNFKSTKCMNFCLTACQSGFDFVGCV